MKEPVAHIARPDLPWREPEGLTECGRPVAEFAEVMTRDEAIAKVKDLGKTRFAMVSCITCWQTASRHPHWEKSPSSVMARSIERSGWRFGDSEERNLLDRELRAIAALIEAHREEFDQLVDVVSIEDLRKARARRQRRR